MDIASIQLELAVTLLGLIVLVADAFCPGLDRRRLGYITAFGLGGILLMSFLVQPVEAASFHGMYRLDELALFFKRLFLAAAVFVVAMASDFTPTLQRGTAGFFAVVLFALVGMMLCASANDFVMLFVSVELITVSFYVLVSFLRAQTHSLEAGTKYLIIGALSSGFMVYGIAFIFGTTGGTNFETVAAKLKTVDAPSVALLFGMLLVLVGLGFKVASVPFQIWVSDVYQGAPTPVTAFLAVGSKAAGFVLLMRVLFTAWNPAYVRYGGKLSLLITALAALTLLYGNLAAIPQRNIKRLMGYSSIGHAGYLLMGLAAANALGSGAMLYYLAGYLFTNLCAFGVIVAFSNATESDEIAAYSGLSKRSPLLAVAMLLAMLSLAGVPPLAGFFGKFLLFAAVIEAAPNQPQLYWLAFIGGTTIIISLYFYLGVVRAMYMREPAESAPVFVSTPMRALLYVAMGGILLLGVYQRPVMEVATAAVSVFKLR